jgi:hypothetical protein
VRQGRKKALLFEKRSKNFGYWAGHLNQHQAIQNKSFLVLFFKKERFLSFGLPASRVV